MQTPVQLDANEVQMPVQSAAAKIAVETRTRTSNPEHRCREGVSTMQSTSTNYSDPTFTEVSEVQPDAEQARESTPTCAVSDRSDNSSAAC